MAQSRSRKPVLKPAKTGTPGLVALIAIVVGLGAFLPAALLLLSVGLIPSATAFITDRGSGRPLFWTVLPLNLAGVLIYVVSLWHNGGGLVEAIRILETPLAWLVMYAAAGAGTLLHFAMPTVVTAIIKDRLNRRRLNQERLIDSMRAEWGVEVCPPDAAEDRH